MNFLAELRRRLHTALQPLVADTAPYVGLIRRTQDPKFGDFQANCAMPLAKVLGESPKAVAERIVATWAISDLCEPAEIAGPGFINLRLKTAPLAIATQALIGDSRLGTALANPARHFVVDYSGPNVAKPMHVGHLRSTVIGQSLDRVLRFLGHHVTSDNHVGDWGTQFGMIIYGYKHFRNDAAYASAPVAELARLYRLVTQLNEYHTLEGELVTLAATVRTREATAAAVTPLPGEKPAETQKRLKKAENDLAEAHSEVASAKKKREAVDTDAVLSQLAAGHRQIGELARKETAKLHGGDAENLALWNEFVPQCLAELQKIYDRFGITFDLTLGESHYNPQLAGIVDRLKAAGLATESQGAMCVFLEGNAAPFIVQKGDGAYTYATTDLATVADRVDRLHADAVLYVVDARQSEHFQQLFETSRKLGYGQVELAHVRFGTILGEDKRPFKTRSGDTVGLESLLDEAIGRALAIVSENDDAKPAPELDHAARARIANIVGMGGIIYADLHHNRDSDYVFNWDKMLATKGDTATYIQYAYARVCGIFRKGNIDRAQISAGLAELRLDSPAERALALQLCEFGGAVHDVCADYRPNVLTQYLFETANLFSSFFENCPVLKETDPVIRTTRLALCDLTARVMKQGLDLLGIQVAEQM